MNTVGRIAYGTTELADVVGVDPKTVRVWINERGLPASKIGGRVLVLVSDFEVWFRQFCSAPASPEDEGKSILRERFGVTNGRAA